MNVKYLAKKYPENKNFQDVVGLVRVWTTPHGYGKVSIDVRYISYTEHYPNGYLRGFDNSVWDGEAYLNRLIIDGQFTTTDSPRNVYAHSLGYDQDYGPEWSVRKIEACEMRMKLLKSMQKKIEKYVEKYGYFRDEDFPRYVQTVFALMGITTFVEPVETKQRGFDYVYDIQNYLKQKIADA